MEERVIGEEIVHCSFLAPEEFSGVFIVHWDQERAPEIRTVW